MYGKIADDTYRQAGEIIDAAHSGVTKGTSGLPNLSHVAAAAAVAMEKGAPNTLYDGHASTAESYISNGSKEWRMLHNAVARVIDVDARDPASFEDSAGVLRHIVADVSHQARHSRVSSALELPDLAPRVPDDLRGVYERASESPMLRNDVSHRGRGMYDELPATDQAAVAAEFKSGSALAPALSVEVRRIASVMEKSSDEAMYWDNVRSQPAPAAPEIDAFRPIPVEAVTKVDALLSKGTSTGNSALDAGIKAHAALDPAPYEFDAMSNVMGVNTSDVSALMARARMVDDVEKGAFRGGTSEIARRIESDRLLMAGGQRDVEVYDRPIDRQLAVGAYHALPPRDQNIVQDTLSSERNVPAITSLRLDIEAHGPQRGAGAMTAQRQAAMSMHAMQR